MALRARWPLRLSQRLLGASPSGLAMIPDLDVHTVNRNGRAIVFVSGEIDRVCERSVCPGPGEIPLLRPGRGTLTPRLGELLFERVAGGRPSLVSPSVQGRRRRFEGVGHE